MAMHTMPRVILLTVLFNTLAGGVSLLAQEAPKFCGTNGMSPWLEWYHENKDQFANDRGADTTWLYVPLTLHLVGKDDGSGYFPLNDAFRAVCAMNRDFKQAYIQFYLYPGDEVRYIDNSEWYEHDFAAGGEMIDANKIPGRLNCFVVGDPAGNCGYSWKDAIVMKRSCSSPNNKTWSHEAGHHFSLPHPFVGWESEDWDYSQPAPNNIGGRQVERVDGSNCGMAADRFCDTRPDYLSFRWNCNDNKESTTVQHDPNDQAFRSDGTLIMGYSNDGCSVVFTPEQIDAMRANLMDEHASYLQITDPEPGIPEDTLVNLLSPIDSATAQFDDITLSWAPVPNAQYYYVELALNSTFGLTLFTANTQNTSIKVNTFVPSNRVLHWRVQAFSNWSLCPTTFNSGVFQTKNLSATNDLERHASALLMPNPATGASGAQLIVDSDESFEALLTMHDAAGRLVFQRSQRIATGENRIEIPTEQLESGLYTVSLQNEMGNMVMRLVILD